jgi:hypothetical protein
VNQIKPQGKLGSAAPGTELDAGMSDPTERRGWKDSNFRPRVSEVRRGGLYPAVSWPRPLFSFYPRLGWLAFLR